MTIGMTCPACGQGGALTIDSRAGSLANKSVVRRRRQCPHCNFRWSTYELPAEMYEELLRCVQFVDHVQAAVDGVHRVRRPRDRMREINNRAHREAK